MLTTTNPLTDGNWFTGQPLMVANSLDQDFVNYMAGLGDGIFFGFGDEFRAFRGIDGGVN
ncbi:MAG: hypothetical protein Q8N51_09855 [Gammaproteobacteria bacterium]|nr:hypothetical protein [Gammaproteobacteria bacterium]